MVSWEVTSRSIYLHSFIYSLKKHLLNIYYMLTSVLDSRGIEVNQADNVLGTWIAFGSSQSSFQLPLTVENHAQRVRAQAVS